MTHETARPERPTLIDDRDDATLSSGVAHFDDHKPPRLSPRLVAASVTAALVLSGSAAGVAAVLDANPSAFSVFEAPPRAVDEDAGGVLAASGAAVMGVPRVLEGGSVTIAAAFAPEGTARQLTEAFGYPTSFGNRPPDPDDLGGGAGRLVVPDAVEICLWSIPSEGTPRGRCSDVDRFLDVGLAVAYDAQTLDTIALWKPNGAVELQQIPYGPTSIEELRVLGGPMLARFEREAGDGLAERDAVTVRWPFTGIGETVAAPRVIAATEDLQMSAAVYQPTPGAGLVMCVAVANMQAALSGSCPAVIDVIQDGIIVETEFGEEILIWEWMPTGVVVLDGREL